MTVKERLANLEQDAIYWKSERIWANADDPDSKVIAIESLVEMLICMNHEVKRTEYTNLVQKSLKISDRLLFKEVKKAADRRDAKIKEESQRVKLKNDSATRERFGIEEDAEGDIFDILKYGIYIKNGMYFTTMGKSKGEAISNFTMQIFYHAETGEDKAYRLISLKNEYGFERVININTDDFVSIGAFKREISRKGNFSFRGSESDLARLSELLQKDEVKAKAINTLGYQKRGNFWAWSNGIVTVKEAECENEFIPIDDFGIVEYQDKSYFIEYGAQMHSDKDDKFINEKKFVHIENTHEVDLNRWMVLFYKSYGQKGIAAILFYIGSIFRDIVFDEIDCFPILSMVGPPGAGKGKMIDSVMSLFGEKQKAIMLGGKTTATGFMRKFAQLKNAVVWLDEFKNNIKPDIIESIKNLYDGTGYERGRKTNDYQTDSTPVLSSCLLSGQEMPTGEAALFMRTVQILFKEGKFSDEQRRNFEEFKTIEKSRFSYITSEIFKHRKLVERDFETNFKAIKKELFKEVGNTEIDDRFIINISVLLAFYHIFKGIVKFPFSYQDAKSFLISNMEYQHSILAGNNEMGKFWGVIESLFHSEQIFEGRDFMLEDGYIYIYLTTIHPLYVKEMRARGDIGVLPKPTLEHYLKMDKNVHIDYKRKRFKNGTNPWCHQLLYNKLNVDLIKAIKPEGIDPGKTLDERNKEMGVDIDDQVPSDLPF